MEIKISPSHYLELMKKSYSLDAVYMLKLIEGGYDVSELCKQSGRANNVYLGILRKGFLTKEGEITLTGKGLLSYIKTPEGTKIIRKKVDVSSFDEWWKAYPGTNTFIYRGKRFSGSRSLRTGRIKCKEKYEEILNEGEYTPTQLLESLKFDVLQKKEESFKQKTNKLTYLQNSLTYLNQRSYEPFIELISEGAEVTEEKKAHDFDI